MASILSTKILTRSQRELVLNTGFGLVEYNAINISFTKVSLPKKIENGIFTSQNAVAAIKDKNIEIERVFCVGQNTRKAIENLGYNVMLHAEHSRALGQKLQYNILKQRLLFSVEIKEEMHYQSSYTNII